MTTVTFKGNPVNTSGSLPAVGSTAPNFTLTRTDLSNVDLDTWSGHKKVLNIFPSIDTPVCATSVRTFNEKASGYDNTVVLNISADLPFAFTRWCGAEGLDNVEALSTFRGTFATDWGVQVTDSALAGLCSRAVVVLDENNNVTYTEQVADIASEPNYEAALNAVQETASA